MKTLLIKIRNLFLPLEKNSDGYHTFKQLYAHRCLLYINWMLSDGCPGKVYYYPDHFDGWDLITCTYERRGDPLQISYHVPARYRHHYKKHFHPIGHEIWDGHNSNEVINRLFANMADI